MIKPDGVQRGLIGEIIKRFEQKGYKLIAMKLTAPGKAHMETHYEDLAGKKFFPGLIEYMTSGPVCEYCLFVAWLSLCRWCVYVVYYSQLQVDELVIY